MDTNNTINALRAYMDFYRNNTEDPNGYGSGNGFQPVHFDRGAQALRFAQSMIGQQQADPSSFFNSQQPAYTPPQSVQSLAQGAGFPLAPQDRPAPVMGRPDSSQLGMGMNFLRNLFSR